MSEPKPAQPWAPPATQLPLAGTIILLLGVVIAAWGMLMDATVETTTYGRYGAEVGRIANVHAMNIKTGLVIIGSALFLSGTTLFGLGKVVEALSKKSA